VTAVVGLLLLGQVMLGQDVTAAAEAAGVDPILLAGAVVSTGMPPHDYLLMTGELKSPAPALNAAVERRLDCISWHESRDEPLATNPRSKAAGLFQFLGSTWAGTPQGRAGLSPYDPVAARQAARWMVAQGRVREWDVVRLGMC